MKTPTALAGLALAAVLTGLVLPPAAAQSVTAGTVDIKARVAANVERFPAETAAARDALCAEIIGLGPAALGEALALVEPPGLFPNDKSLFLPPPPAREPARGRELIQSIENNGYFPKKAIWHGY